MTTAVLAGLLCVMTLAVLVLLWRLRNALRESGNAVDRATYETLHTAWSAAPPLRAGLVPEAARRSAPHLRALLDTPALALTDGERVLAWDGIAEQHSADVLEIISPALTHGRSHVARVSCSDAECPLRFAVMVPLHVDGRIGGVLLAYAEEASAGLVRAANEVARWAGGQLELAELDRSKQRLIEAEVRALRAQISPHFIFNSLTAIASYVRTNPERARTLLLDFAEFTRYSFRRHGEYTTLAEELRSIDQYLSLERARFGERLQVTLRIAPEVLPVAVPFLCMQPLVENAVRHGMEGKVGPGHISIQAADAGAEAHISIEDDGVGMDPERLRRTLAGEPDEQTGIALGNIDERLRQVYGDEYGLVVETAVGAGTKIHLRVPKYRPGIHAD
ncbi:sensor histidine kinase [Kutzneria sp. 744]|uniref:sensor histidine kinase n=1 Tax=Kutzneria sp. (strain 744) TaxID=345341 RepID=UPI0003EEA69B|nr:histidine kinase [Kutzneria sp. 744]EWM19532.1 two-component system, LytT family, sensor kinase [Kutzneria sp. 744]